MDVPKSVDGKSGRPAVDIPTVEELTQFRAEMLAPPRVYAYELATEAGCAESTLSKYLNQKPRGAKLPSGMGMTTLRSALASCKRRKAAAA